MDYIPRKKIEFTEFITALTEFNWFQNVLKPKLYLIVTVLPAESVRFREFSRENQNIVLNSSNKVRWLNTAQIELQLHCINTK